MSKFKAIADKLAERAVLPKFESNHIEAALTAAWNERGKADVKIIRTMEVEEVADDRHSVIADACATLQIKIRRLHIEGKE